MTVEENQRGKAGVPDVLTSYWTGRTFCGVRTGQLMGQGDKWEAGQAVQSVIQTYHGAWDPTHMSLPARWWLLSTGHLGPTR
jgi:hypothetical protein